MGNHGASARPDPGRCFSTLLTLIPGATSQEQRLQHAPGLQCALAHSWGQLPLPKHSSRCSAQNSCSAHLPGRTERSFPQVWTLKKSIRISERKYHIPFQRAGEEPAEDQPTHPPEPWGWGTLSGCALLMKPQRWPSFGSQQALKSRPALWPSVQERQETPALPSKAQGSL